MGSQKKTANLPATGPGKRHTLKRRLRGGVETSELLKQPNLTESRVEPENEKTNSEENTNSSYDEEQIESKKQSILRIGVDGKSEYISLDNMPINKGNFNQYRIGNGASVLKLYGINITKDKDALNAMITAFGVDNIDKIPPICQYMREQCKFDGMNLVINALKQRKITLSNKIQMLSGISQKLEMEFLKWIGTTIQTLETVPQNAKVCEPSTKKTYSFTLPGMPKVSLPSFRKGCPCLEEMSLLRDLVVVVSMLMGIANEDVKQQLENIPIQNLLEILKGSDKKAARAKLDKALETLLLALQSAEKKGDGNGVPMKQLRIIYEALEPQEPKENVTVDDILSEIRKKLDLLKQQGETIENAQTKEKQLRVLMTEKEELEAESNDLRERLDNLASEYTTLQTQKGETEQELQRQLVEQGGLLQAERDRVQQSFQSQREENQRDVESRIAFMAEKAASEAAKAKAQFDAEKAALDAKIAALEQEIADLKAAGTTSTDTLQQKDTDLTRLQQEKEGAEAAHQEALEQLRAEHAAKMDEMTQQLEQLTGDKDALAQTKTTQDTDLAALRSELEAKTTRIAELEEQIQSMADQHAAALAAAEEARQKALEDLSGESNRALEELRAELASTKDALQKCESDKQSQTAEASEQARQAAEQSAEEKEELNSKLAALEAAKAELERQLEEKGGNEEVLQRQLEEARQQIQNIEEAIRKCEEARKEYMEQVAQGIQNTDSMRKADSEEKEKRISELEESLAQAVEEKKQLQRNLNAERAAKPGELAAAKREAAQQQMEADQQAMDGQEKECDEKISQLQSQLAQAKKELEESQQSAQGYVANLQSRLQQARENSSRKNTEIHDLQQSLDAAQAATSAATTGATQRNAEQKSEIVRLQGELAKKNEEIAQKAQSVSEDTQRRLNTLLGTFLVNPEVIEKAKDYVQNGDDAVGSKLQAVQTEVCEFFRYLFDTIHIQLRQIEAIVPFRDLKLDIFKIFPGLTLTYDSKALLKELTVFFQEFFGRLGATKAFGSETIDRKPLLRRLLSEILTHMNRVTPAELNRYKQTIMSLEQFKFLFDVSVMATQQGDSVQIGIFRQDETRKMTPLIVLAVKMIQLLASEIHGKYGSLVTRCGLSGASSADSIMTGETMGEGRVRQEAAATQEAARQKAEADAEAARQLMAARAQALADKAKTEEASRQAEALKRKLWDEERYRLASQDAKRQQEANAQKYTEEQKKIIEEERKLFNPIRDIYGKWKSYQAKCSDVYNKIYHAFFNKYSGLDKSLNSEILSILVDLRDGRNRYTDCISPSHKSTIYTLINYINPPVYKPPPK